MCKKYVVTILCSLSLYLGGCGGGSTNGSPSGESAASTAPSVEDIPPVGEGAPPVVDSGTPPSSGGAPSGGGSVAHYLFYAGGGLFAVDRTNPSVVKTVETGVVKILSAITYVDSDSTAGLIKSVAEQGVLYTVNNQIKFVSSDLAIKKVVSNEPGNSVCRAYITTTAANADDTWIVYKSGAPTPYSDCFEDRTTRAIRIGMDKEEPAVVVGFDVLDAIYNSGGVLTGWLGVDYAHAVGLKSDLVKLSADFTTATKLGTIDETASVIGKVDPSHILIRDAFAVYGFDANTDALQITSLSVTNWKYGYFGQIVETSDGLYVADTDAVYRFSYVGGIYTSTAIISGFQDVTAFPMRSTVILVESDYVVVMTDGEANTGSGIPQVNIHSYSKNGVLKSIIVDRQPVSILSLFSAGDRIFYTARPVDPTAYPTSYSVMSDGSNTATFVNSTWGSKLFKDSNLSTTNGIRPSRAFLNSDIHLGMDGLPEYKMDIYNLDDMTKSAELGTYAHYDIRAIAFGDVVLGRKAMLRLPERGVQNDIFVLNSAKDNSVVRITGTDISEVPVWDTWCSQLCQE